MLLYNDGELLNIIKYAGNLNYILLVDASSHVYIKKCITYEIFQNVHM